MSKCLHSHIFTYSHIDIYGYVYHTGDSNRGAVMGVREDARRIKALSDESRLAVMLALRHGEKCACTLMTELGISQPTLSHHMRILCDSGLVSARKDGKWVLYSISALETASFRSMIASYTKAETEAAGAGGKENS